MNIIYSNIVIYISFMYITIYWGYKATIMGILPTSNQTGLAGKTPELAMEVFHRREKHRSKFSDFPANHDYRRILLFLF